MSSIRESIDRSRMTAFQAGVVGMCLVINLFEGFDVLVIAFAASGIAKEWSLTASQVGLLLSSSLVGMALGSALIAPLSDRIGRRPHTLICLAVCTLGGLAGTLLLSVLALKVATRTLTVLAFLGAGLSYLAMSLFLGSTVVALAAAVAIGLFVNASGNALNSIVPGLYPASVRATGVGWAMAVGRLGAFSAPALAGLLLDHGWSARSLFGLLVLPLVLVAALIAVIVSSGRRSRTSTEPAGSLSPVN